VLSLDFDLEMLLMVDYLVDEKIDQYESNYIEAYYGVGE
jgi:hypothetical protein